MIFQDIHLQTMIEAAVEAIIEAVIDGALGWSLVWVSNVIYNGRWKEFSFILNMEQLL